VLYGVIVEPSVPLGNQTGDKLKVAGKDQLADA